MRTARSFCQVNERRGHLTPVAKLQRAFSQAASGDHADGVGHAAIDLDEGDEALAVATFGVFNAQQLETEHGHAHAQHLPGTQMTVGNFCLAQQLVKRVRDVGDRSLVPSF